MTTLSIVVPCYNEAANLERLVAQLDTVCQDRSDIEVILVDNGSHDQTPAILAGLQRFRPYLRHVRIEKNIGYGHGIMTGLREGRGEFLAWTHADLQTDPADVIGAYQLLASSPDPVNRFVKGRRRERPLSDAFFTWGMAVLSSLLLKAWLVDINAQPKIFHRFFLQKLTSAPDDFSLDLYTYFVAIRSGMEILEFPVCFGKRMAGVAKGGGTWKGKLRLIRRTWAYMLVLRQDIREGRR